MSFYSSDDEDDRSKFKWWNCLPDHLIEVHNVEFILLSETGTRILPQSPALESLGGVTAAGQTDFGNKDIGSFLYSG